MEVPGFATNEPIITNSNGARQSRSLYAFDLLDPQVMLLLANTLKYGADKYAPNNWRGWTASEQYNHLMAHLTAWKAGDKSEYHPANIICRCMFLVAKIIEEEQHMKFKTYDKETKITEFIDVNLKGE
jgi:hypothetical protein